MSYSLYNNCYSELIKKMKLEIRLAPDTLARRTVGDFLLALPSGTPSFCSGSKVSLRLPPKKVSAKAARFQVLFGPLACRPRGQ